MISQERFERIFPDAAPFVTPEGASECIDLRLELSVRLSDDAYGEYLTARDRWPGSCWALEPLREMGFVYGVAS